MQVFSCSLRDTGARRWPSTLIVLILIGLFPETISAASQRVSTKTAFLEALANVGIDTIYITSSFTFSGSHGLFVDRSVNIFGNCSNSALDTPGCSLIIDDHGGLTPVLHIEAVAQEISVHIEGVRFYSTQGTAGYRAITCGGELASAVVVEDSVFHGLRSEDGGALFVSGAGCAVTCRNCSFTDNQATSAGGALHVQYGSLICDRCSFSGNHAKFGGAIYVTTGGHVELYHPSFSENVATIGGADIFIENLPFAALSFCPWSRHPNATGSPRAPMDSPSCASDIPPPPLFGDLLRSTSPRTNTSTGILPVRPPRLMTISTFTNTTVTNITGPLLMTPLAFAPEVPPTSSSLSFTPTWGVSLVPAGRSFVLKGVFGSGTHGMEDATLNLTLGLWEASGGSCSGFLLDRLTPSQGGCLRPGNTAACTMVCYLGQVQPNNTIFLRMTVRAVAVGAQLVMGATVEALGRAPELLPVQVTGAFGVEVEPVRVVDALQAIIAPAQGKAGVRHLAGGPHQHAFAGTAGVLHFMVIGPALGRCNLTEAIHLEGMGQLLNVTAEYNLALMLFDVLALPDSALVLRVDAGACRDADGQPSKASEPFPLLVDVIEPSVAITSIGRRRSQDDLAVFRIQFSEQVYGFSAEGIEVQGGQLTCLSTVNASEGTYEAVVKPLEGSKMFSISSIMVKEGGATDTAGNPCTASLVSRSQCECHGPLSKQLSISLKSLVGFSLVMSVAGKGSSRVAVFIGHLQFFQMIGALDVPLSSFLKDALYNLAWVNNAWPKPVFGTGADKKDAAFGSSAPHLFFASNGSCRGQAEEDVMTPGNGTLSRRQLGDTADDGWHYMTLAELDNLLQQEQPSNDTVEPVINTRRVGHLESQGDVGVIVLLCLCQLAGCLALRAVSKVVWRTMNWLRPSPRWEALPAVLLFPRLELLVLMLTFPTVTQASMFYMTSGFDWGVLIGACVGAAYPLAFVAFVTYFLAAKILRIGRYFCFQPERVYFLHNAWDTSSQRASSRHSESDDGSVSSHQGILGINPAIYRQPYLLEASWLDCGAPLPSCRHQYGLLFQDLKGPTNRRSAAESSTSCSNLKSPSHLPGGVMTCHTNLYAWSHLMKQQSAVEEWSPHGSGCLASRKFLHAPVVGATGITWGHLAVSYTLVAVFKQFLFSALSGISSQHRGLSHLGWFQVCTIMVWLVFHAGYVIVVQPFISQAMNILEAVTTLCELGSLACCLGLLITNPGEVALAPRVFSSIILVLMLMSSAALFLALSCCVRQCAKDIWQTSRSKLPTWFHDIFGTCHPARQPPTATLLSYGQSPVLPPQGQTTLDGSGARAALPRQRSLDSSTIDYLDRARARWESSADRRAPPGSLRIGRSLDSQTPRRETEDNFLGVNLLELSRSLQFYRRQSESAAESPHGNGRVPSSLRSRAGDRTPSHTLRKSLSVGCNLGDLETLASLPGGNGGGAARSRPPQRRMSFQGGMAPLAKRSHAGATASVTRHTVAVPVVTPQGGPTGELAPSVGPTSGTNGTTPRQGGTNRGRRASPKTVSYTVGPRGLVAPSVESGQVSTSATFPSPTSPRPGPNQREPPYRRPLGLSLSIEIPANPLVGSRSPSPGQGQRRSSLIGSSPGGTNTSPEGTSGSVVGGLVSLLPPTSPHGSPHGGASRPLPAQEGGGTQMGGASRSGARSRGWLRQVVDMFQGVLIVPRSPVKRFVPPPFDCEEGVRRVPNSLSSDSHRPICHP
eukprot:jgi/Mesvir1/25712/Mv01903-RA.1